MDKILETVGSIAGIGGLALGVFLLLFRRIQLPPGTRRHLTLFMWLVWSICILGIIAYILGQYLSFATSPDQPQTKFKMWDKAIHITYPDNDEFIDFLLINRGETIQLKSSISMDVSSEESYKIFDSLIGPEDSLRDSIGSDTILPLEGLSPWKRLTFNLLNGRALPLTHGGSGVNHFPIRGYFEVEVLVSGNVTTFMLTELPVTIMEQAH